MKSTRYSGVLVAKVDARTRKIVDDTAYANRVSIAEVVRDLLNEGLKARGLNVE